MIGKTITHYRILQKIGGGGMGIVYKAEDTRLRRTVALKFLPPELTRDEKSKKRFLHEAQAASSLDHPNICNIHEISETAEGQMFISMAYYEGTSVKPRIAAGPMDPREVFEIAFSVAEGLALAHDRGIIHRDIKPGNVMITTEGFVKIVDFGLAKLLGRSRVTASDTTLGTVGYMSPEQARGEEIDLRTDVWSLGALMYEMVTGKRPFRGEVDPAIVYSILNEDPIPIGEVRGGVPAPLVAIVERCLQKNADNRYADMGELMADLLKVAQSSGWQSTGLVRSVIRVGRPGKRRRNRFAMTLFAVSLVVLAALMVWQWQRTAGGRSPYSTDTRVIVLPFENLAGDGISDAFVRGLYEDVVGSIQQMSNNGGTMWVVPFDRVGRGQDWKPRNVEGAFGVNRVITGSVQRFENQYRLSLDFDL